MRLPQGRGPAAVVGRGGCLLHVGLPKTATTAVQHAASTRREELLAYGVRYPGKGLNHSRALSAILTGGGMESGAMAQRGYWDALQSARASHPRDRFFVSSELVSGTGRDGLGRLKDALGPDLHVVVTVRPFAAMLPSVWQQYVKQRNEEAFDDWLERIFAQYRPGLGGRGFWPRHSLDAAVEPWVEMLGPDQVSVVVADSSRPRLVFEAFEELLGLPDGLLDVDASDARGANRGLTYSEVELLRHVNAYVRERGIDPGEYREYVRFGLVGGLQAGRIPPEGEHPLRLPAARAQQARQVAQAQVERVRTMGVRVVGDLEAFAATGTAESASAEALDRFPISLVSDALACTVSPLCDSGVAFMEALTVRPIGPADRRAADTEAALSDGLDARLAGRGLDDAQVQRAAAAVEVALGAVMDAGAATSEAWDPLATELRAKDAGAVVGETILNVARLQRDRGLDFKEDARRTSAAAGTSPSVWRRARTRIRRLALRLRRPRHGGSRSRRA